MGTPGSIISNNTKAINKTCEYVEKWNGNKCPNKSPNTFEWTIASWEILDEDRLETVFRPWLLYGDKFYNKITPNMDNEEEIYDISGRRFPRY